MLPISFQAIHFSADHKLREYMQEKLNKLDKFHPKVLDVQVFLKLENAGQIKDKIVELKVAVPGQTLLVTEKDKKFESAFDVALEALKRQLKKSNDMSKEHR
jgi:putative sigma-54 modulation protein